MKRLLILILLAPLVSVAQAPMQPDAAHIYQKLKKLDVLASVLYVAAHPDDENTRVIAYFSNDRLYETGYLAMTRGDGGQNLLGPEIRDQLGLIRTQELLAARRIDGGKQFFTRANDFGYSKSADEALRIWGKDSVLSDVITVFREFKPDVIITRFPPDSRAGHGHHTASAMLAIQAFDMSGKENKLVPANGMTLWQPKRLFINTGRWWMRQGEEQQKGVLTLNVGGYNPLLGESYTEIASRGRSMHKSQGFGATSSRGDATEYFEFVKGDSASNDLFDGVNTTWTRVKGGDKVQPLVEKAIAGYDMSDPAKSVPALLQIRKAIVALDESIWKTRKLQEVDQLIDDCMGLFMEADASQYWMAPGEKLTVDFELINRSEIPASIESIHSSVLQLDTVLNATLKNNEPLDFKDGARIDPGSQYSDPYWLREPHSIGLFTVRDKRMIGKAENDPAAMISYKLKIGDQEITLDRPLVYRWTDRVKGELYRPFEIVPPVFVNIPNGVAIFDDVTPQDFTVMLRSSSNGAIQGTLKLKLPDGWRSEPASIPFNLAQRDDEKSETFKIFPSKDESTAELVAVAEVGGKEYDQGIQTIDYSHIPIQTLLPQADAKLVRVNLKHAGNLVGYIAGAGDDVPAGLRNMGYQVWEMKDDEVTPENLAKCDAVVLGVRALITNDRIPYIMPDLLNWTKSGGTLVVQYNNNYGLLTDNFAPYPIKISYDRVTEEDSPVKIINPDSPVLTTPNKIMQKDFDGWVQERGLYFPNSWDPQYSTVLSMNDTGESPKEGSLLVTKYGSGYYVYTGISFFRQLPAGVPGAYKLFANLVSLGHIQAPSSTKVNSNK